jgi:plastocyanin
VKLHRSVLMLAWLGMPLSAQAAGGSVSGKVDGPDDQGRPWVVYLEGVAAGKDTSPAESKEMLQKDMNFSPQALVVPVGANVEFKNVDKIFHNVFSPTAGSEFDLGLYRGGMSKVQQMQAPGEVDVYCNIHPGMHARILVVPNRFHAQVGPDGRYEITDVPPGRYTLVAWSATHEPVRKSVAVAADRRVAVDFTFKGRPFPLVPHLNKDGDGYGRYKN